MAYPAQHLDVFIDLMVEALLRDIQNESAPAAVLTGQATEARYRPDEDYPIP